MVKRAAIVASCFVGAFGLKASDQYPLQSPLGFAHTAAHNHPVAHTTAKARSPTLSMQKKMVQEGMENMKSLFAESMHKKVSTEVNMSALSPKAKAKFTEYKNPSMATVHESHSRQSMQRWIQTLMRPVAKGVPPLLAGMIPGVIMTMAMNHRAKLPIQEKILFDDFVAMKPPMFVEGDDLPILTLMGSAVDYLKGFALAFEEAGMNDLSKKMFQAQNTTSLILETQLPFKVVGFFNKSSVETFLQPAMLEDAAAILDERGWTSGAHSARQRLPLVNRVFDFEQVLNDFGNVTVLGDAIPHMPSAIEAFFNILEMRPKFAKVTTPEFENKTMHTIMESLAFVSSVGKAHVNRSHIHDGRTLADELEKIVYALAQSGPAFNTAAGLIGMSSVGIRELAAAIDDMKKGNTTSDADRVLAYRRLANRGEKFGVLLPLTSFFRDAASMVENNTADAEHMTPRLAKLMNEEKLGQHMVHGPEFGHGVDLYAKMVCSLHGLKESIPICAK